MILTVLRIAFWVWVWRPIHRDPAIARAVAIDMAFWRLNRTMEAAGVSVSELSQAVVVVAVAFRALRREIS